MIRRLLMLGALVGVAGAVPALWASPAGAGPTKASCVAVGPVVVAPTGVSLSSAPFTCPITSPTFGTAGVLSFSGSFTTPPSSLGTGNIAGSFSLALSGGQTVTGTFAGTISRVIPDTGIPQDVIDIRGHGFDPNINNDVLKFAATDPVASTSFNFTLR
jgi:hypothetical protein